MQQNLEPTRYDVVIRSLHWLTVLLVAIQFAVAWTMPDIHRGTPPTGLIARHLSIGTAILAVILLRAAWRVTHPSPTPPLTLAPALQILSRVTHIALYALLVALPLTGWANASARGWNVTLFGFIPLPPLSTTDSSLGHALGDLHQNVAIALLVVIGLHVLGALYHAVGARDGTLQRML